MTVPEGEFLHGLEVEAQADLGMIAASGIEETAASPVSEWQFDPTDAERDEIAYRSLLGAVEALETDDPQ